MGDSGGLSVQELHAPSSICFGCGPANEEGLKIRSFRSESGLEMEFEPSMEHQAFPGMINGGIIGTLLDCHGNWTAAIALMDKSGDSEPPCTVTASYSIKLRRPTPFGSTLRVTGEVTSIRDNSVNVKMALMAEDKVCATGEGVFVAVTEGHPAFHRWN
ncbi:MAG: thioesterase [Euryarchaeota archaeon]|nr:thioesterase [Euryarchaeota archaeon]|tara:strand:- start:129 stop:605 length:477 start_codon:yes stop_codon:yes gene_type:complete